MNEQREGPILESRHHEGLQPKRKNPTVFIVIGVFSIMILSAFFFVAESAQQEQELIEDIEAQILEIETRNLAAEEVLSVENPVEKEEGTVDFFYNRAMQRDESKDYKGAVEDYNRTIELAKKYSIEMWESLNNRGVILAEQFDDLSGAIKDFDKIIEIELNRTGEIDVDRLRTSYSNRAYVKMAQGNNVGACDDLYEALSYADENSMAFLEQKIAKNCE